MVFTFIDSIIVNEPVYCIVSCPYDEYVCVETNTIFVNKINNL